MIVQQQTSAEALRSLKHDYHALQAPPYLATRIRAGLDEQARRSTRRRPVYAAIAIVLAVLALLPFMQRQQVTAPQSLASLSLGMSSVKLPPSPSLARLRSVRTPTLPPRPVIPKRDRTGKQTDVQTRYPKENTHEVT